MGDFDSIFERHKVAVLQFSGGKDSLACLWLLQEYWPRLHVAWVNSGDAFPETVELMRKVRALVPSFIEVASDQPAQVEAMGYPSDVLPVRNHPSVSRVLHPHPRPRLQSFYACCRDNLWEPMQREMQRIGATLIIRGQRADEHQRSPVQSGEVCEGVEYLFPLEQWSAADVMEYVATTPLGLPVSYLTAETSLDCQHCTGHLFENEGKMRYMREYHPALHKEVSRRLMVIKNEVASDMGHLQRALCA